MFAIHDRPARLCDGIERRELLRVGGLSALGLSLPTLLAAQAQARSASRIESTFGRAKNVIFLWLQGGPAQHETFDPKPEAVDTVRGEFKPIQTNIPGIHVSELLPRTAAMADKYAIIRSMCTHSDLHDASAYWMLTGYKYTGQQSRQISPADWPYLGSIVKMFKPSTKLPAYSSVWLPDVMRLNDNVQPAGQTAGFLGKRWEPERVICDPSGPEFKMEGLALPKEVSTLRMDGRKSLLAQVEQHFKLAEQDPTLRDYGGHVHNAFGLLANARAHEAFDIGRELRKVRDRYGRGMWGQCVLLARRLIEAGARLVHVNWPRETGDAAIDNPMWDTHAQGADRMQDVLCPQFDISFTALLEDLEQRGLLAETLVVATGEFGRTPTINANGGRDHWGHVFSLVLAGAGIAGGQVIGASDKQGAYPKDGRLEPQELTATIFHLLGIGDSAAVHDRAGRPMHLTTGTPIAVLGDGPATDRRVQPEGNPSTTYTDDFLLNTGFEETSPLVRCGSSRRPKGWQALPICATAPEQPLGVLLSGEQPRTGKQHAVLGIGPAQAAKGKIAPGARALLVQEVRNPRAGKYTFSVHAAGGGASAEAYRDLFAKHFSCRLMIAGYVGDKNDLARKDATKIQEFASLTIQPVFGKYEKFELTTVLRSQDGGAFQLTRGICVAVIVQKMSAGDIDLGAGTRAFVCIDDVALDFVGRERNEDVKV